MTIVGHVIHGGAAIHGPKEPCLTMLWAHLWSFVRGANGS